MIEETCVVIGELEELYEAERVARYARRNKIRYIDELLNEFEMLNLAEEGEIPLDLQARVVSFLAAENHTAVDRGIDDVAIADWMEALYDIQDTLMIPFEDDID